MTEEPGPPLPVEKAPVAACPRPFNRKALLAFILWLSEILFQVGKHCNYVKRQVEKLSR